MTPYRPRGRVQRGLAWLDEREGLGTTIEWIIVVAVIVGLIALIAAISRWDADLDVSARVADEQDARVRAIVSAEAAR